MGDQHSAGEDDKSTEQEGSDDHLHEDQKSRSMDSDDGDGEKNKVQKRTKAGREGFDPNAGAD